jgi:predicted MFS family arabinose efflux permease
MDTLNTYVLIKFGIGAVAGLAEEGRLMDTLNTYALIRFGIGAVAVLAFLIIKIATKPKLCDMAEEAIVE